MKTVIVSSSNLFVIAAAQLGDATQWIRIAQVNGLSDPTIDGIMTLSIPAINKNAGGGVGSQ